MLGPGGAAELPEQLLRSSDRTPIYGILRDIAVVLLTDGPPILAELATPARGMAQGTVTALIDGAVDIPGVRVYTLREPVIIYPHDYFLSDLPSSGRVGQFPATPGRAFRRLARYQL